MNDSNQPKWWLSCHMYEDRTGEIEHTVTFAFNYDEAYKVTETIELLSKYSRGSYVYEIELAY